MPDARSLASSLGHFAEERRKVDRWSIIRNGDIVGPFDERVVVGITPDLEVKNQDLDGYENWLASVLMNSIGGGVVAANTRTRFETLNGETVCLIDVKPAESAVYASTTKGKTVFYVRVFNTTHILEGPELQDYISDRFG